jgi:hypothetical protein
MPAVKASFLVLIHTVVDIPGIGNKIWEIVFNYQYLLVRVDACNNSKRDHRKG